MKPIIGLIVSLSLFPLATTFCLAQTFSSSDTSFFVRDKITKTYHLDVENPSNEIRATVAHDFTNLTTIEKDVVLSDLWPRVRCAEFINVLLPLAKLPESPEQANGETSLDRVVLCLLDLKPETVRPLILEDLHRPKPLFSLCVLLALPDKELPDLDDILVEHLNYYPADVSRADIFKIAPIIERYATGRIQSQVMAFYKERQGWAVAIEGAFLRYQLKHNSATH